MAELTSCEEDQNEISAEEQQAVLDELTMQEQVRHSNNHELLFYPVTTQKMYIKKTGSSFCLH